MRYHEARPAPALDHLIRCYWFLDGPDAGTAAGGDPALPDGSPELIINFGQPFRARTDHGVWRRQPAAFLVGQITRPFHVAPAGPVGIAAARFTPYGAAILGLPMAPLTNRWVSASRLHEGRRVARVTGPLRDAAPAERVALLNALFGEVAARGPAPDPVVVAAVRAITETHGARPVSAIQADLGVGERTLQRRFAAQVGISPKLLARIARFQRVFGAWRENPSSWARVAVACGYFDQSHLVRDFRDFAGEAPAAFLASAPEFTRFFLG